MYYYKQNIKKLTGEEGKALHLTFKYARAFANDLINQAKNKTKDFRLNASHIKAIHKARLGEFLCKTIVGNINISIDNYYKNMQKDASYNFVNYKKSNSEWFLAFWGNGLRIIDNTIKLNLNGFMFDIKICSNALKLISDIKTIKMVRLHEILGSYYIVIEYNKQQQIRAYKTRKSAGIDLGVDTLIACYAEQSRPLLISGKQIKFINYVYMLKKRKAISNKELNELYIDRQNKIKAAFNVACSRLFAYLNYNNITHIYIGDFNGVKDKGVASNFYNISYYLLKRKFKDYARKNNIYIEFVKEDYTSKSSFLDFETPIFHSNFAGSRIERGLFVTKNGYKIQADLNGAAQILSKKVYVADRSNILSKPWYIDLIDKKLKAKSLIKSFLNKYYKKASTVEEKTKIWLKDISNYVCRINLIYRLNTFELYKYNTKSSKIEQIKTVQSCADKSILEQKLSF